MMTMNNIVSKPDKPLTVNKKHITKLKERDWLLARHLEQARLSFISLLQTTPSYAKLVMDKLNEGDIYVAKISNETLEGLRQGKYEKMLKNDTGLWNGMIRKKGYRKPIVEQTDWQKIDVSHEILSNMALISLQASMAEVTEGLFDIDQKLDKVLSYQQTDRVSQIMAGIQIYEQAYYAEEITLQAMQLSNALQSLNEGRTKLMLHLEKVLQQKSRDEKFTDYLWRVIRVDKQALDLQQDILQNYDLIKEDIKYINLSSIYIFRSQTLLNQHQSAQKSKQQYLDFCSALSKGLVEKEDYLPYEMESDFSLEQINAEFKKAELSVSQLFDTQNDLIIEIEYEELLSDGNV